MIQRRGYALATPEEVADVASRLRPEDYVEGFALRGVDLTHWIPENYTPGNTYVIFNDKNENVALTGVEPVSKDEGLIWMVATPDLEKHGLEFLRACHEFIDIMCRPYKKVGNVVHARNEVHLKWLKWLGFEFKGEAPLGPLHETFIHFEKVM